MQHTSSRTFLLVLIGVSAFLAGCGRPAGSPSADATPSGTPGAGDQLVSGQVTLALDKQTYQPGDTIVVTINNGLSQTISTTDHQTNCTLVTAEYLAGSQWQAVGACRLMTPTRIVPLPANSSTVQQLVVPESSSDGSSWPAGTYRVTLVYSGGDEGTAVPGGLVHSAEFTIA